MSIKYTSIPGHFTKKNEEFYDYVVEMIPEGGVFVELGVLFGKSLVYLVHKMKAKNKSFQVIGIDNFSGTKDWPRLYKGKHLARHCKEYLKEAGVLDHISLIETSGDDAAQNFADASIDGVYIDACHEYEDVKNDIKVWTPKVKKGGLISGDDFIREWSGVIKAVKETLPSATNNGRVWWVHK